jgi:MerR family transcriptional regulator, repressor of the yfmOP operon
MMARQTQLPSPTRAESEAADLAGAGPSQTDEPDAGLRISDAARRAGVSPRTLRYYEELGLLTPSGYTAGGERRYQETDLMLLERIIELKDVLGMNLEEIRDFLASENRLDELRAAYRTHRHTQTKAARLKQKAILDEALELRQSLIAHLDTKLTRMDAFRAELAAKAERVRQLLAELE